MAWHCAPKFPSFIGRGGNYTPRRVFVAADNQRFARIQGYPTLQQGKESIHIHMHNGSHGISSLVIFPDLSEESCEN